jgi:two-component system alkaline phosphatase synthesis response regulator PhoP
MRQRDETILVIEDDPAIRTGLELNLRLEGYHYVLAESGEAGLKLARQERPDLIILDLMLPGCSGLDVLHALRDDGNDAQVLIVSALGEEENRVRGLKMGADDYITKPFSVAELFARIDASLRRVRKARRAAKVKPIRFGDIEIDLGRRRVKRAGDDVAMSKTEFDLLVTLAESADRVFSREQLLSAVWGVDYEGTTRTVDNFIRSLRAKLEENPSRPQHLKTVHGVGYRLVLEQTY